MKVYVEDNNISNLDDLFQATNSYECWAGNCGDDLEIVSLSDYTKQVRKEVVQKIKERSAKSYSGYAFNLGKDVYSYTVCDFVLDQIKGENNV